MSRRQAILICLLIGASVVTGIVALYPSVKGVDWVKLWPASKAIPAGFYEVTGFVDGDTFAIDMNGTTEKVRLIGVDTPETHKPDTPVQCFGPEASAFTEKTIKAGGSSVRLEADKLGENRDIYGRLLRYAYLPDGGLLQQSLIELGYGFAYTSFPFSQKAQFVVYQSTAEAAYRGLWTKCHPTLIDGRWQSNIIK